jgi:uncharacterized membrane protein YGL010W
MSKFTSLMAQYKESHQHPTNQHIHWVFVPLIYLSVIGLLWDVKLGVALDFLGGQQLNVAMVTSVLVFAYYLSLSFSIAVGMLITSMLGLIACYFLDGFISVWAVSLVVFVVSWIFQFIGHKVEGKKAIISQRRSIFSHWPSVGNECIIHQTRHTILKPNSRWKQKHFTNRK